jgi:hypothetical protein
MPSADELEKEWRQALMAKLDKQGETIDSISSELKAIQLELAESRGKELADRVSDLEKRVRVLEDKSLKVTVVWAVIQAVVALLAWLLVNAAGVFATS